MRKEEIVKVTRVKILRDIEAVRVAAMAKDSFMPALKAIELMGRHIGMWRIEGVDGPDLAQLIAGTPVAPPDPDDPLDFRR
jgi:hypothetical protein